MSDPKTETVQYPFTAFNFRVEINLPDQQNPLCSAAFSECDGLEMTMAPKTIREGGNHKQPIHLLGNVSYGQLSLKRGMTKTHDLWNWFNDVLRDGKSWQRASCEIVMFASDGTTVQTRFILANCLPVKLKAPPLNAKDGLVAIEEMQIAYERLEIKAGNN